MKAANSLMVFFSTILIMIMLMYSPVLSKILYVPEEYLTIQRAINESFDGDVVLVSDGVYKECIEFQGKRITVASYYWLDGEEGHIAKTVICRPEKDKPQNRSLVTFNKGENNQSVLIGFTLTEGMGTLLFEGVVRAGGAILCLESAPSILNNRIEMNIVSHPYIVMGAGIFVMNNLKNPLEDRLQLKCNQIIMNQADGQKTSFGGGVCLMGNVFLSMENNCFIENSSRVGGGMAVLNSIGKFTSNIFNGNSAEIGGGMFLMKCVDDMGHNAVNKIEGFSIPQITSEEIAMSSISTFIPSCDYIEHPWINNCTFVNNYSKTYGGAVYSMNANTEIMNSILWENFAGVWGNQIAASGKINVKYSDIQGGWHDIPNTFNFDTDPAFVDEYSCCLNEDSPCVDAGNPEDIYNDPEDKNNPGYARYPAHGTLLNDVGAYGGPCACSWSMNLSPEKSMGTQNISSIIPNTVELFQNYPNPFNPTTSISFNLNKSSFVQLRIFDLQGREVKTLISAQMSEGTHQIQWNAANLAGGVYIVNLKTADWVKVKKIILLK